MLCVAAGLCIRVPGIAYCIVLCSKDVLAPCNLLRIYLSPSGIFSVHFDLFQNLVAESDTLRRSLRSYPDMMTSLLGKMTRHSLCHVGHSLMALPALYLHLRLHHVCFRDVDHQTISEAKPSNHHFFPLPCFFIIFKVFFIGNAFIYAPFASISSAAKRELIIASSVASIVAKNKGDNWSFLNT